MISSPHNRTFLRCNPACHQSICPLNIALNFPVPDITSPSRGLSSRLAGAVPNPPPILSALCISPAKRRRLPRSRTGVGRCPCLHSRTDGLCSPTARAARAARSVWSSPNPCCVYPACPDATETPFSTSLFIF